MMMMMMMMKERLLNTSSYNRFSRLLLAFFILSLGSRGAFTFQPDAAFLLRRGPGSPTNAAGSSGRTTTSAPAYAGRRGNDRDGHLQQHNAGVSYRLAAAHSVDADESGSESGLGGGDPVEELSDERKANLFQFLLRDLQVEGVPLLGVDADQVHTLQAAMWTTMAEFLDSSSSQQQQQQQQPGDDGNDEQQQGGNSRACLIFEDIPVSALRSFVDDFTMLKTQTRLADHLPELDRINLSLVGKGVGPAILIEVEGKKEEEEEGGMAAAVQPAADRTQQVDENRCTAAMKMFVDRVVVGLGACPHYASSSGKEVAKPAVSYRVCTFADVCHALGSFWNCICEMMAAAPDDDGSADTTTILLLPNVVDAAGGGGGDGDRHGRFSAVSELISRSLCLYQGDAVFDLLHFSPTYDRSKVHPEEDPAHGHIPPLRYLRAMLQKESGGSGEEGPPLSESDLSLSNYQRKAPVTAVCIKRIASLDAATDEAGGVVDLQLEDGSVVPASGIPTYVRNARRLSAQGEDALQSALEAELAIVNSQV